MKRSFIISGILLSFLLGVALITQGSGIVPAIVPALVPTANKTSTTSTVFALASSNALTASSAVCTNANGDMTTTACTTNAVTSTTPVTVNANSTSDQKLMELSLTAGYLNSLGRPFDFFGAGVYTTQAAQTPTLEFKIKLCTVSGCGSGTVVTLVDITSGATTAASTNISWNLRTLGTTAATGATGNLEIHGPATIDLGNLISTASTVYGDTNTAVSSNIDLTAALFVDFTVKFSTNAAGANTCTQREGVVSPGGATSSGGGGGALTQISRQVLGAPASSVTFSGIAGTYSDLILSIQTASSVANNFDNCIMQVNGDTGTNYDDGSSGEQNASFNANQHIATATASIGGIAGNTSPSVQTGTIQVSIINYAGTTFYKSAVSTLGWLQTSSITIQNASWWQWRSTAAITSIKLFPATGPNFVTGSTFTLWGRT